MHIFDMFFTFYAEVSGLMTCIDVFSEVGVTIVELLNGYFYFWTGVSG